MLPDIHDLSSFPAAISDNHKNAANFWLLKMYEN